MKMKDMKKKVKERKTMNFAARAHVTRGRRTAGAHARFAAVCATHTFVFCAHRALCCALRLRAFTRARTLRCFFARSLRRAARTLLFRRGCERRGVAVAGDTRVIYIFAYMAARCLRWHRLYLPRARVCKTHFALRQRGSTLRANARRATVHAAHRHRVTVPRSRHFPAFIPRRAWQRCCWFARRVTRLYALPPHTRRWR